MTDPVKKPWWYSAVMVCCGLLFCAAATGITFLILEDLPHYVVPATGLFGGMLFSMGVLGHRPGRYRVIETDEKLTLWVPLPTMLRVGALAGAFVVPAAGIGLVFLQ